MALHQKLPAVVVVRGVYPPWRANGRPFAERKTTNASAFTLIELMLALSLSVVLLALIGSAIQMGITQTLGSRDQVEQARLVDGVISLIATDIANTANYEPQDLAGAMSIAEATAEFDVDSIDSIGAPGGGGSSGGGSSGGGASSAPTDSTTEAESLRRPLGVYGTLGELQIDVHRSRPQFAVDNQGAIAAATATGEVTTVLYKLGAGTPSLGANIEGDTATGLVRLEVQRDLLNWADQMGSTADMVGQPLLIAAEVSRIEFRYYDGTEVYEEWDSELQDGELPRVIELRIWFRKSTGSENVSSQSESFPYVMTLALRTAWNPIESPSTETEEEGSDSSTGGTSSTGGAAGGGR